MNEELLWLFFAYALIGWFVQTLIAATKQRKFVNKGMVNLPFHISSGFMAVFIKVFFYELSLPWIFIGSMIFSALFDWVAGHLIEKIYHERWWDYSGKKWNLDGYICLSASVIYGISAVLAMKWGNTLLLRGFHFLPTMVRRVLLWTLVILLAVDILATWLVMAKATKNPEKWAAIDREFDRYTERLTQKIYQRVNRRVERAYPKAQKLSVKAQSRSVFAEGCCFYKLVWLFVIGCFLGDIVETIFCYVTAGVWMSRSSLVWGPFSIVWGFAMVAATVLLYKYRDKPDGLIFIIGTFLGGAYEYICSVLTELVFGKVFWDYSHMAFNLGGRINLLYCFFWGIAAVLWIKWLYPMLSAWIEKISVKTGTVLTWFFVIFMSANMLVSALALIRSTQRYQGIEASYGWQTWLDVHYDDETMNRIYPNAKHVE